MFFYKLMIVLFKEMKAEVMIQSDFADIIETAKSVIANVKDWPWLIQETDGMVLKSSEIVTVDAHQTPQKEMEESESIWKKMMDHRLISFFR